MNPSLVHATPEPCNDNGERLIAAMKVDGMVAANTFYPCGVHVAICKRAHIAY